MITVHRRARRKASRIGPALAAGLLIVGCHTTQPLGPPIPTGATTLGGSTMTSTLPPPPGWKLNVATPTNQQQAQDTVLKYLKQTLSALPPGTNIDAARYGSAASTAPCNDAPLNTNPPREFSTIGELKPPGDEFDKIIATVGDTWNSWGWWVYERDDFRKPNRFGYAPDGYTLQIKVSSPPGHPPTIIASSPCFPHDIARDDLPFPTTITAGPGS